MAEMSTILRKYLHEALDARDAHAIGGIHQTLHQIMELDVPGMPVQMVPPQFAAHVRAFEAAKCEAMPPPAVARLRAAIDEAAAALRQYAASLTALETERRELYTQQMALYYSQQQQQQFQFQQYRMPPAQPQSLRADIDSYAVSCARLDAISAGMRRLMENRTQFNATESSASSSSSASSPPSASAQPPVAIEWHFLAQLKAKKIGDLLATMMGGGAGAALEPRVLASLPDIPMHWFAG
jgi:hypothetical protein